MTGADRRVDGGSFHDQPKHGWPVRRVIWSCAKQRGPLLTRYYLIETRWFAIYLHHLHASDEDRALHDHPWSFITILLSGGYFEHYEEPCLVADSYHGGWMRSTRVARRWRHRFSILRRPALWRHRLELVRPTWTLVLRSRRLREWGFVTDHGWLHWKEYGREFCD